MSCWRSPPGRGLRRRVSSASSHRPSRASRRSARNSNLLNGRDMARVRASHPTPQDTGRRFVHHGAGYRRAGHRRSNRRYGDPLRRGHPEHALSDAAVRGTRLWDDLESQGPHRCRRVSGRFGGITRSRSRSPAIRRFTRADLAREMEACDGTFYSLRNILRRAWDSLWHRRRPLIAMVANLSYRKNLRQSQRNCRDFLATHGAHVAPEDRGSDVRSEFATCSGDRRGHTPATPGGHIMWAEVETSQALPESARGSAADGPPSAHVATDFPGRAANGVIWAGRD